LVELFLSAIFRRSGAFRESGRTGRVHSETTIHAAASNLERWLAATASCAACALALM
jgi:hypothetical protein